MVVRAFLPERMFVTGASPMTLTRASRRESRQNPGGGGANARPGTWGAGRALKPRIARSRAGGRCEGVGRRLLWLTRVIRTVVFTNFRTRLSAVGLSFYQVSALESKV